MWLRRIALLSVIVMVSRCGNNGQSSLSWPAHITSYQGFSAAQVAVLKDAISEFNDHAGVQLLEDNPNGTGSGISVVLVTSLAPQKNSSHDALSQLAGRATLEDGDCQVEIAEFVLEETGRELVKPVTWHELGHCAGLTHVAQQGQIMFRSSMSLPRYDESAVGSFFETLLRSIGMKR